MINPALFPKIYFWSRIVSPHRAPLAVALAQMGCEVVYVSECEMSEVRANQGWISPVLSGVVSLTASNKTSVNKIIEDAPLDSIHLCQGIRGNGLINYAQVVLRKKKLKQWVLMETVDTSGLAGNFKSFVYKLLFMYWAPFIEGVLATGYKTKPWLESIGVSQKKVYPFAYFLPEGYGGRLINPEKHLVEDRCLSFIYVGSLIPLKRVGLLIRSFAKLKDKNFKLFIVGSGPQEQELIELSRKYIPDKVQFVGKLPMDAVPDYVRSADCLILPSRYDGWGAVVSEALLLGTRVICSDACGSADVAKMSGGGTVFKTDSPGSLVNALRLQIKAGKVSELQRHQIRCWAENSLTAKQGALYLLSLLDVSSSFEKVKAPWEKNS